MKNAENVASNDTVNITYTFHHKNLLSIGNLDGETRKSRKVSSEDNEDDIRGCKCKSVLHLDDVSVKETSRLENYVPECCSISRRKMAKRKNSQNFTDDCLITQRINQYLSNVINDQDLQTFQENHLQTFQENYLHTFQENHQISRKRQECKEMSDSSRTVSPNVLQYNFPVRHENQRHFSRKKSRQQYPRKRNRYSRKHYWEDFEGFRKELDDDVNKLETPQTEKDEDYLHKTFERCDICDEEKDQVIFRTRPRKPKHGGQDNKSTRIRHRQDLNHSMKRNKLRKGLELRKVSKSKNSEPTSMWSYL